MVLHVFKKVLENAPASPPSSKMTDALRGSLCSLLWPETTYHTDPFGTSAVFQPCNKYLRNPVPDSLSHPEFSLILVCKIYLKSRSNEVGFVSVG